MTTIRFIERGLGSLYAKGNPLGVLYCIFGADAGLVPCGNPGEKRIAVEFKNSLVRAGCVVEDHGESFPLLTYVINLLRRTDSEEAAWDYLMKSQGIGGFSIEGIQPILPIAEAPLVRMVEALIVNPGLLFGSISLRNSFSLIRGLKLALPPEQLCAMRFRSKFVEILGSEFGGEEALYRELLSRGGMSQEAGHKALLSFLE